jgi:biotin-dependent carboxylase-like uncharacterized protein
MEATLDGAPMPYWRATMVKAGQVLALGRLNGPGMRAYLAVRGGFDAPLYMGSRATFSLGGFGGHTTGVLKAGDTLRIGADVAGAPQEAPAAERPVLTESWDIGVLYGPHGAPDFFTDFDIETLFATEYKVHFNSARTGVRLIGPAPQWARRDGGEAGLHPSNIHDNAYAIGALDFTGDMPIILGPDGPSLGGFVCPFVVIQGDLWKLGQLAPGDAVRLECVAELAAGQALRAQDELLAHLERSEAPEAGPQDRRNGISHARDTRDPRGTRLAPENSLPPPRRPTRTRGVWAHRARSDFASASARADARVGKPESSGGDRYHAGHPLASGPIRQSCVAARVSHEHARSCGRSPGGAAGLRNTLQSHLAAAVIQ